MEGVGGHYVLLMVGNDIFFDLRPLAYVSVAVIGVLLPIKKMFPISP